MGGALAPFAGAALAEPLGGYPGLFTALALASVAAALLALGSGSGHSSVWGRLLGSTAEKASGHAPCSVLIVR
ncbi:universal stress protein [Streptomyces sp. NPDC050548]|uniref:universal stress protein n=1 Tax=Streptomyces sp. NPDC050548 TaxID=3365629 RepID=UPI0037B30FB3